MGTDVSCERPVDEEASVGRDRPGHRRNAEGSTERTKVVDAPREARSVPGCLRRETTRPVRSARWYAGKSRSRAWARCSAGAREAEERA